MAQEQASRATVSVRTNGDKKEIPHVDHMTAKQAAQAADMRVGWTTKYFVGGSPVRSFTELNPGDEVTLSPRIKNG